MKEFALTPVFDQSAPLYRQLYRYLAEEIQSGHLPAGTKLPSKRQLCSHLGISMSTVETAYGLTDESAEDLARITLDNWSFGPDKEMEKYSSAGVVSPEAKERLFEAIMADFAEGNLGVRYVADTEARMENCFVNDLNIYFDRVMTDKMGQIIVEYPTATVTEPVPYPTDEEYYNERISVTLQVTAKHTLAVLAEEGMLDVPVQLITQGQSQACDIALQQNDYNWDSVDERDYVWAVLGE